MTLDPENHEPKVIELSYDEGAGTYNNRHEDQGYAEGGLWSIPVAGGFILPLSMGVIPNYLIGMFAGASALQPSLGWAGVTAGFASTFALATIGKNKVGFSKKDSVLAVASSLAAAGVMMFGLSNGWMSPPKQPYINMDRFDWSSTPVEELKKHWCAVDINGNQNPAWDGRNLNCGPRPDPAPLYK